MGGRPPLSKRRGQDGVTLDLLVIGLDLLLILAVAVIGIASGW